MTLVDSTRPFDPFRQQYEYGLYEADGSDDDDDIDYEKVIAEIAQMLIEHSGKMKEISLEQADAHRKFWMDTAMEHAGLYDFARLGSFVGLAKIAIEIATIATIHNNLDLQNNAAFKEVEAFGKITDLFKQFMDTRDQGLKIQLQALSELAKSCYEYTRNDEKNSDAQIQEALRKIYDFIREIEGQKQGLTR